MHADNCVIFLQSCLECCSFFFLKESGNQSICNTLDGMEKVDFHGKFYIADLLFCFNY